MSITADIITDEDMADYRDQLGPGDWEYVGTVGVDSGQLMIVDPCYVDAGTSREPREGFSYEAWLGQLFGDHNVNREHKALEVDWSILPGGAVIAPTAYGDGGYPVFVRKDSCGRIVAMQVITGDVD